MGEFWELIKNFERIREYIRQFYVYGFKVRSDFTNKSTRTYDNERRRIESFLSSYIHEDYTIKGKHVSILVDCKTVSQNPLYAAWKSKSFTDNDIMLHFFLLDLLRQQKKATVSELTDKISIQYGVIFDSQMVRLKLKEYEEEGIFVREKQGNSLFYQIAKPLNFEEGNIYQRLISGIKLFQEVAPFGFVGSTILDKEKKDNNVFRFKHHFIVHTLEDGILYYILQAMKEKRLVIFENKSRRSGNINTMQGVPLKIFVSTQTGRRYLCIYRMNRFINLRLDCIAKVKQLEVFKDFDEKKEELERNLNKCWGVSFNGTKRIEEIFVKFFIDEKQERFVLNRLYRESRGGEILRIKENVFLYSAAFFDTNEMLPWLKTFTGRILDIQGTNTFAIKKIYCDLQKMYEMYNKIE